MLTTYQGVPELDTALDGFQLEAIRQHAGLLDTAAYGPTLGANLSTTGRASYIHLQRVSAGLFRVLGTPLELGREFSAEEDVPNGPALAVISDGLWRRAFHGAMDVAGKTIAVNGNRYTIVGVAPPQFRAIPVSDFGSLETPDVYTPLRPSTQGEGSGDNYGVVARMAPGTSLGAVNAQLRALAPYIRQAKGLRKDQVEEQRALPLQAGLVYDIRTGIRVMWAAVICVLVLGCVNIAGLLLARSSTRATELAVRSALGAGRLRIAVTLLIESLTLGVMGAALGIAVGRVMLQQLIRFNAKELTLLGPAKVDGRVVGVAVAVSIIASLLLGLLPAFEASRVDLRSTLAKGGRASTGQRRGWARYLFVFAEVGLAMMLVTAAGLLARNLLGVTAPNPGFDGKGLLVAPASLADPKYADPAVTAKLFRESTALMEQIPGVQHAAVAMAGPYTRPLNGGVSQLNGHALHGNVELNYVTARYFETLGLHCLDGRTLRATDGAQAPPVVVVNDRFVKRYSPNGSPVGWPIQFAGKTWTIVGVSNSVQENNHLDGTLPLSFYPEVYVAAEQFPAGLLGMANQWFSPVWLVRARTNDVAMQSALQKALQEADPAIAFAEISTSDAVRAKALGPVRYRAWVVGAVSVLAALLAAIGLYGLVAQAVTERTREMGLRMALGATTAQVIRSCVTPALMASLAGLATGSGGALAASRMLQAVIWNVATTDPATYLCGLAGLTLLAGMASVLPALRLARISAARILQEE